jgi:glycosyltransferase involved in cell wall biosynthesis
MRRSLQKKDKIYWLTWENHRRSRELAKAINAELIVYENALPRLISLANKALLTILFIFKHKPRVLIIQNPSIILGFLASILRLIFAYKLIVDRHTNFRIGKCIGLNPRSLVHAFFSRFNIKYSDLTIVTNEFLRLYVEKHGGNGFVLQDKLPTLDHKNTSVELQGDVNIVFICTYANDEPVKEVIKAGEYLPQSIYIYITGNPDPKKVGEIRSSNIILTGFLNQQDYDGLLCKADILMDFTNLEWCLVCGAYEAISLEKPLITSDTLALKDFLEDAAVYTDHSPKSIAGSIKKVIRENKVYKENISNFRYNYMTYWQNRLNFLQKILNGFLRDI